jgi:hypothetical protein
MFAGLLWGTGTTLEGLLLFRSIKERMFSSYPAFYVYLSYIFLESFVDSYVYLFQPARYVKFYWYTQFLSVALGYGAIWEIFRQALKHYPGAARMARSVLAIIFFLVFSKVLFGALTSPLLLLARTTAELERSFRIVQAALLMAIMSLLAYYAIPVGRNLKGMIAGYGLFIGVSVIILTLRSYLGDSFQPVWQYLPAITYYVVLLIWCFTLWSYQPNPRPEPEVGIERHYQLLAARTTGLLVQMRGLLAKAIRP